MSKMLRRTSLAVVAVALVWMSPGCADQDRPVVYCSVDETFARQVLARYEEKTGVKVDAVYDTEAGKTTGLIARIRAEGASPRADVLFSGEVFHTIALAREGLLEAYAPSTAAEIADHFKDPEGRWTGIGLRARVLAFDSLKTPADAVPMRWEELAQPQYASKTAFANPLFGTTCGHVAAMFALWGTDRATAFLTGLRDNGAKMVDGNSAAVREVMAGRAAFCMTDADDVRVARKQHPSLEQRFLDLGDGGTLLIPSSVAVIKGCAHPDAARQLVDFLVSAEVERLLAVSESGNIPVRRSLRQMVGAEVPPITSLTYDKIADAMPQARAAVREILIR